MQRAAPRADHRREMPAPDAHSFRYEPELCTLVEGQTLEDWRRTEPHPDPERPRKRRRTRRRRPNGRRDGADALSGR
jgi:hypothetical protein